MNKNQTLLIVAILALAPLAGCIENMADLKDRIQPAATEEPLVNELPPEEPPLEEEPEPLTPPVARITAFGANNALIYKADFIAEDQETPFLLQAPVTVRLLGGESEALEAEADIESHVWNVAGTELTGAAAEFEIENAGEYPIMLTVVDTNGETDTQRITILVLPEPFTETTRVRTGTIVSVTAEGVPGDVQSGTATYSVSSIIDDKPHVIQSIVFRTLGGDTCDPIIEIVKPDGTSVGPQDSGAQETVSFGESDEGDYVIHITGYYCVAPDGIDIEVETTFLEIVEGLPEVDGHAHQH